MPLDMVQSIELTKKNLFPRGKDNPEATQTPRGNGARMCIMR